jgi:hypothetical protein
MGDYGGGYDGGMGVINSNSKRTGWRGNTKEAVAPVMKNYDKLCRVGAQNVKVTCGPPSLNQQTLRNIDRQ